MSYYAINFFFRQIIPNFYILILSYCEHRSISLSAVIDYLWMVLLQADLLPIFQCSLDGRVRLASIFINLKKASVIESRFLFKFC